MIILFEIVDILIVMPIAPDEHPSPIKRKVKEQGHKKCSTRRHANTI